MCWRPNSEEDVKAFMRRVMDFQTETSRKLFELAAVLKEDGALIRGCGLPVTSMKERTGCIGYIYNKKYRGARPATQAAEAFLRYGFDQLRLHGIWAACDTKNIASSRVKERLGMQRKARFREDTWIRNKLKDSCLYAILDRELIRNRTGHLQDQRRKGVGVAWAYWSAYILTDPEAPRQAIPMGSPLEVKLVPDHGGKVIWPRVTAR